METWVRSLVWDDSTCPTPPPGQLSPCTASTGPTSHRPWAHEPQPLKPACPRAWALQQEKPQQSEARAPQRESSPCLPQLEKAGAKQQRPSAEINHQKKELWQANNKRQIAQFKNGQGVSLVAQSFFYKKELGKEILFIRFCGSLRERNYQQSNLIR